MPNHRCLQLASMIMINREERVRHQFQPESTAGFTLLDSWPWMAVASSGIEEFSLRSLDFPSLNVKNQSLDASLPKNGESDVSI